MMLIILRHQSYSTSTHTNCLIQFVKERFDQVFRLNRGRAFYSSLSICQAALKNFSFLLNRLAEPKQSFRSAGGAYYSIRKHCQPPAPHAFQRNAIRDGHDNREAKKGKLRPTASSVYCSLQDQFHILTPRKPTKTMHNQAPLQLSHRFSVAPMMDRTDQKSYCL